MRYEQRQQAYEHDMNSDGGCMRYAHLNFIYLFLFFDYTHETAATANENNHSCKCCQQGRQIQTRTMPMTRYEQQWQAYEVHSLKFYLFISIFWRHPQNCCCRQRGGWPQLPTLPTRTTNTTPTKTTLAAPAAADANEDDTDGHHLLETRDRGHFVPSISCFEGNIIYFILVNVIIFSLI